MAELRLNDCKCKSPNVSEACRKMRKYSILVCKVTGAIECKKTLSV